MNGKVTENKNKVGELIKEEFWRQSNWCRKDALVNVVNTDEVGLVVYNNAGTFEALTETKLAAWDSATDEMAILIDERVSELAGAVAGDVELAIMYRGNAILSKAPVTTSTADPVVDVDAMYAVFAENLIDFADYLTVKTVSKV